MKKVILVVTTVVLATVSVYAQSAGAEVRLTDQAWRGAFARKQAQRADSAGRIRNKNVASQLVQQIQRQQAQHAMAAATSAVVKPATRGTRRTTASAANTREGSVKQWLKAIFLGGRFPGESASAYHTRLSVQSQPASLPFK